MHAIKIVQFRGVVTNQSLGNSGVAHWHLATCGMHRAQCLCCVSRNKATVMSHHTMQEARVMPEASRIHFMFGSEFRFGHCMFRNLLPFAKFFHDAYIQV